MFRLIYLCIDGKLQKLWENLHTNMPWSDWLFCSINVRLTHLLDRNAHLPQDIADITKILGKLSLHH